MYTNRIMTRHLLLVSIFLLNAVVFTLTACKPKTIEQPTETLLVKVRDKTISLNEFIRRAEYTIRPIYCRGDYPVHKKIVLNSLIAEKLLAYEAGEAEELLNDIEFKEYLRGRKEQAMRQWNYKIEALDKVELKEAEVQKGYKYAGRTYRVSFINLPNHEAAHLFEQELQNNKSQVDEAFQQLVKLDSLPEKIVEWSSPEPDIIHDALFSDSLHIGQIIGPLKIDNTNFLVMRINGWTTKVVMSETEVNQRWQDVREKLTDKKAQGIYEQYVAGLMLGKKIVFDERTFRELVNIIGPEYYRSDQEKQSAFNKKFWNRDSEEMILDDLDNRLEQIADQPLFTVDGKTWTVREYEVAILAHPLVFRKRDMPKNEFAEQFKLAIVDMVRDQYITSDAYRKGLDQVNVVQREYEIWRDNLLGLYQKYRYLDNLGVQETNQIALIEEYLNPYIISLRQKYSNQIEIDTELFNDTQLTGIDMFVVQRNVAFPIIVPGFPLLTTDDKLDYGRRMNR